MISDNEAISVIQLSFSIFAHILETQAQVRMIQARLKKLQQDGWAIGVLGLGATFLICCSYLSLGALIGYKKYQKNKLKIEQRSAKSELKRFRGLMSLHRLEEETLALE